MFLKLKGQCFAGEIECKGNDIGMGDKIFSERISATFQYRYVFLRYRDSHYKHKTIVRRSYFYNGNSFTCKAASWHWDSSKLICSLSCFSDWCSLNSHSMWECQNNYLSTSIWKPLLSGTMSASLRDFEDYRQTSNIRCIKSPKLNVCRLVLQLSLPNPLKPGIGSRMKT